MTLKEEATSLSQESAIKNNEISYLRDSLQSSKQDAAAKEIKLEETREELRQNIQILQSLTKDQEILGKSLEEERKNGSKLKKDWEEYRKDTTKALERLIEEIGKDEDTPSTKLTLLTFPDSTISAMQAEAIKKRGQIITRYQGRVQELESDKSNLEQEIRKLKKNLHEKEEDYQKTLKAEKEKSKQAHSDYSRQRE